MRLQSTRRSAAFFPRFAIVFGAILALGLVGCQPAAATPQPAVPTDAAYPGADLLAAPTGVMPDEGYPGVVAAAPTEAGGAELVATLPAGYPGDPGMTGVQVIENRSKVTARLNELAPSDLEGMSALRVTIVSSDAIGTMQNFTDALVGQDVELFGETAALPALQPGDSFTGEVEMRGDERGQVYYVYGVQKVEP